MQFISHQWTPDFTCMAVEHRWPLKMPHRRQVYYVSYIACNVAMAGKRNRAFLAVRKVVPEAAQTNKIANNVNTVIIIRISLVLSEQTKFTYIYCCNI